MIDINKITVVGNKITFSLSQCKFSDPFALLVTSTSHNSRIYIFSSTILTAEASFSSIKDIKNSPTLGSTNRKRTVLKKCIEVMASLNDVSAKYSESISCVLGNAFIFGDDTEVRGQRSGTPSQML